MGRLHTKPTVLWRHARWRCESICTGAVWTGRLWIDDIVVAECAVDNPRALFHIARTWFNAVGHDAGADIEAPAPLAHL